MYAFIAALLDRVFTALAAYLAGKAREKAAVREADAESVERAKDVADSVNQLSDDTVVRWLRDKYTKR
jgi:uncharacterized membrane protein YccC